MQVEPWLRGTRGEAPAIQRAVMHALDLAEENARDWCEKLSDEEMNAQTHGLASVAFHVLHMAGSVDRLLTYAEGRALTAEQGAALEQEGRGGYSKDEVVDALVTGFAEARKRILRLDEASFGEARFVGSRRLPTTLGGLLVHVADHTQRHAGQLVTTSKLVAAMRYK